MGGDIGRCGRVLHHLRLCGAIYKQGGRDLSYGMLSLYLFGVLLWLAYGLLIHAQAEAPTNGATAILIAAATILKAWKQRRDLSRPVAAEPVSE